MPGRLRKLAEPVRREWVAVWLCVVLVLSLWAIWSSSQADDAVLERDREVRAERCVRENRLIDRANRDATDMLAEQWTAVKRLEAVLRLVEGADDNRAHEVISRSVLLARQNLTRRLSEVPANEIARVRWQLEHDEALAPTVWFVTRNDCAEAQK